MTTSRDRILDGAVDVMRSRGLARASTKEIARAAGVSEALLYKLFADKTDLLRRQPAHRHVALLRRRTHGPRG
jgi:AcrR family transcriptional regulator